MSNDFAFSTPQQVLGKHAGDARQEAMSLAARVEEALSRPPRDGRGWLVKVRGYSQAAVGMVVAGLEAAHWRVEPRTVEEYEMVQAGLEAPVRIPAIYIQPSASGSAP